MMCVRHTFFFYCFKTHFFFLLQIQQFFTEVWCLHPSCSCIIRDFVTFPFVTAISSPEDHLTHIFCPRCSVPDRLHPSHNKFYPLFFRYTVGGLCISSQIVLPLRVLCVASSTKEQTQRQNSTSYYARLLFPVEVITTHCDGK